MSLKKFFFILALAFALFLSLSYIYTHSKEIRESFNAFENNKNIPSALKTFTGNLFRDFENIAFDIERKKISKEELPILEIYMSNAALRKIETKRKKTLEKPKPILLSDDSDWVKATIVTDNGKEKRKVKTYLRLKGDWGDHLEEPKKLSFRIKVRGKEYIFGMKKLSIQHPKTRNYHHEAMILWMMRKNGVLAPRYFLTDVRINGYKIGIMALEEHFSKELVESQDRREGPILAIDEDVIWKQRDLNYNVSKVDLKKHNLHPDWVINIFNDYPVKEFKQPKYIKGTIKTNNTIKAQSLLRDYIDEKLPPYKVFDYKSMSMWWILENIWGAYHGIYYQNKRFYFNPITSLLEPVAFDNIPNPFYVDPKLDTSKNFFNFRKDDKFLKECIKSLKKLENEFYDPKFIKEYENLQQRWLYLMSIDGMNYKKVDIQTLRENLRIFIKYLYENYDSFKKENYRTHYKNDGIWGVGGYEKLGVPLASHIRAFAFLKESDILLEIKNQTTNPIKIENICYIDKKGNKKIITNSPFTLNPFKKDKKIHIITKRFIKNPAFPNKYRIKIDYRYKNKKFSTFAPLQFRDHYFGFSDFFLYAEKNHINIDKKNKRVIFKEGNYTIDKNYVLKDGWSVLFEEGVNIEFKNGALLKIEGSLMSLGSALKPVIVKIKTDPSFKDMGSWGGIFVLRGDKKSKIIHTVFKGERGIYLKNRQDYYGITGCISFYESEVDIKKSEFLDMQCEDALNIVRSSFKIEDIMIKGSHADAFDSDFSKGEIKKSKFIDIGNDGIDVSGTDIKVIGASFRNITDKAVSVGEKSTLFASGLDIQNSSSGVVSKDLSRARIENSFFKNISGSALLTFIKKEEYGAAFIECKKCRFENVRFKTSNQAKSTIIIDGKRTKESKFTKKQLEEAGYVIAK